MNYLSIYNAIIDRAISQKRRKYKLDNIFYVYYEKHHITPKCLGGTNLKENLVLLTASEHFVAHQLLVKIYPNEYKLVFALRMLCGNNKNSRRSNKEYSWIKQLHAEKMSLMQKGKPGKGYKFSKGHTLSQGTNNGMSGKTHSVETKELLSLLAKSRLPESYDFARLPKTDSHKENMRTAKQIRRYKLISPNGTESIFNRVQDASKFSGVSVGVLVKLAGNRYGADHCRNWKIFAMII